MASAAAAAALRWRGVPGLQRHASRSHLLLRVAATPRLAPPSRLIAGVLHIAAPRRARHLGLVWQRAQSSSRPDLRAEDDARALADNDAMAAAAAAAVLSSQANAAPGDSARGPSAGTHAGAGLEGVGLSERMLERLAVCGITDLFPVQRATFSALMTGKDMLVKARTGSGKTLGFALPIIEKINAARTERPARRGRTPQAVVLAPTRELAMQIQREFLRLDRGVTSVCVYGGAPAQPQERALREGVDVAVGTPGRMIDMLERGVLRLADVQVFVLDEADEMLKMGFQEDVERIMEELPAQRQMNLWSATQPRWITQMANKYCNNLEKMDMVGSNPVRTADTIRHIAAATSWDHRGTMLANLVRVHAAGKRVLVFCNTKLDVEAMAAAPELKGMSRVIHGDVNQQQRERTLADFRKGAFNVLVATDVAARGIDVPDVALVIQTKIPEDQDTFVHRSGRTGRAGRAGVNCVLYNPGEEGRLLQLANEIGITFALEGAPSQQQLLASRQAELSNQLDAVPQEAREHFRGLATELLEQRGVDA
ncbi:MAG: DEAD/DEAH box helicase, partial [Promethearchaeia archaeon]